MDKGGNQMDTSDKAREIKRKFGGNQMDTFDECSDKAREIKRKFIVMLGEMEYDLLISFKEPYHDIAARFLNEIVEFEPLKEIE